MITLTSKAPEVFYSGDKFGETIYIQAVDGTFAYHYLGSELSPFEYTDVHPDPDQHLFVPSGGGDLRFIYKKGKKV